MASKKFVDLLGQLTWYPSIFNRITGVGLSGVLYAASLVYLFHPLYPALDSAHLISLVHSLPTWVKGGIKFVFAVPFTFHTFNGIRHLAWDTGFGEWQCDRSTRARAIIRGLLELWITGRNSGDDWSGRPGGLFHNALDHSRLSAAQLLLDATSHNAQSHPLSLSHTFEAQGCYL